MNKDKKHRICPVERAGTLTSGFRKLVHNPKKILQSYIKEGMTILDLGCGPGFFSIEMAKLAGRSGKVIAADIQEGMLNLLQAKIHNTGLENRIKLHKCLKDRINLREKSDLILAFYMLHEVPDLAVYIKEIKTLLKPGGKVIIAEPKFEVSKKEFAALVNLVNQLGFDIIAKPKIFFSRAVVIQKSSDLNRHISAGHLITAFLYDTCWWL